MAASGSYASFARMQRVPQRAAVPQLGALGLAAVLLLAVLFAGDSFWVAAGAVLLGGGALALSLLGVVALPRGAELLLGSLLALAAWSGLSVLWSIAPDRSWEELNRTLAYAGFALVGVVLAAVLGPRACRSVGGLLLVCLGAAVLWSLAGKAIPALFEDGGRAARLRDPIGYWNALALAADSLLVLALWVATSRVARPLRVGAAILGFAAVLAVLLAVSRAGLLAAVAGVALWLLLGDRRLERGLVALAVALPALAVGAWAFTRDALVEDGQPRADRVADGGWFALACLLGAVAVAGAVLALERYRPGGATRRRLGRSLAAAVVVALVVGVGAAAATGDPLASNDAVGQNPSRLGDVGLNKRGELWREAWRIFEADPLAGSGAGTFEIARKRYRDDALDAAEPHDVPLQFLATTGLVGLALFGLVLAAAAAAAVGALRRLSGPERTAAAALAVLPALYLLHALVDYDWDFPAVTGPALLAVGALAAAGREPGAASRRPLAAGAVAAVTLTVLVSLTTPWLSERSVRQVNRELDAGDIEAAEAAADRARSLNPLSIDAVHKQAAVAERRRNQIAAREAYARAIRLQPENPDTWYALGVYEHDIGALCQAYVHLNEAYTLDPRSLRWFPGGPLDVARDHVNEGNC
jgi:tetratricopeptide (TPR) repeat protein